MKNKIFFIGSQCVKKQSQNLACQQERPFRTHIPCQWPMKMITVLWCRFQQCLGTFIMLLLEGSSETGIFRHLSDYVFAVRNFENTISMKVIFFFKISKFNLDFGNGAGNSEKVFSFWDNCIWIGIVKLSLLRAGYFSLVANVLTSRSKILHVNTRDFFQLNFLGSNKYIW